MPALHGWQLDAQKLGSVAAVAGPGRNNAFNLIRLTAALLVFVSHEHLMTQSAFTAPGYFGVDVFFIISGFLVARSWELSRSALQYFRHRALRILPALWAVVLMTTFVVGPLVTSLPLSAYFTDSGTWRYLLNLVFDHQMTLPGVFSTHPYPIVNMPLWSLAHEAFYYVTLATLGMMVRSNLRHVSLAIFVLTLLLGDLESNGIPSNLMTYFFAGATVWQFRDRILFDRWLLLLAVLAFGLQATFKLNDLLCYLSLPYLVLWLGLQRPPAVFAHFLRNDYSYGWYVWAMVCQQCAVNLIGVGSLLPHILLAGFMTAVCAFCSWHLLEKNLLKLKAREDAPEQAVVKA